MAALQDASGPPAAAGFFKACKIYPGLRELKFLVGIGGVSAPNEDKRNSIGCHCRSDEVNLQITDLSGAEA